MTNEEATKYWKQFKKEIPKLIRELDSYPYDTDKDIAELKIQEVAVNNAIQALEKQIPYEYPCRKCGVEYCYQTCEYFRDWIKEAEKAVEKQIPKSPTIWKKGKVIESYECPLCDTIYDFKTDGKLKYCHECGQRLKWR